MNCISDNEITTNTDELECNFGFSFLVFVENYL